jgi:hypothetical protein
LLYVFHLRLRDVFPEPDASTAGRTRNTRIDQFNSRVLQSRNHLHQGIDIATYDAVTRFHALDGWYREIRQSSRLPLIYVQERTGSPELIGGNHELAASGTVRIDITTPYEL